MDDTHAEDHPEMHDDEVVPTAATAASEGAAVHDIAAPWEEGQETAKPVVPLYPDHVGGAGDSRGGVLLALGLIAAAVASVFFLYNADSTGESTLVARAAAVEASPTEVPATAVPTATAAPEPTAMPEAAPAPEPAAAAYLLSNLAGDDNRLGQFNGLVAAAGLAGALGEAGPLTVFAPTDEAFASFTERTTNLRLNEGQLRAIAENHVVAGLHPSSELVLGTELNSLADSVLTVRADGSINGSSVIEADLAADNGLAHVIDGVMVPMEVLNLDQRLQLMAGVNVANDLFATAGVTETLGSRGPLTVFVPSDFAVDGIAPATLDLVNANAEPVAKFHVVEGLHFEADLTPGTQLVTTQGEVITISDGPTLNGGLTIVNSDIVANNGVAHLINGVLVPGTLSTEAALNALFALEPVQFAVSSAQILPQSQVTLNEAVAVLLANPVGDVAISGHTDTDGGAEGNLALSQARAESVLAYLVAGGVDADRLTATGFGETSLKVDPEITPEDKAQNRRIEFLVE